MAIIKQFETIYNQKTKHRKKCRFCNKLIADGTKVMMQQSQEEKWYPVKGLMGFTRWIFTHLDCYKKHTAEVEAAEIKRLDKQKEIK